MSDLLKNTSLHKSENESKERTSLLMTDFTHSYPEWIKVPQLLARSIFSLFQLFYSFS